MTTTSNKFIYIPFEALSNLKAMGEGIEKGYEGRASIGIGGKMGEEIKYMGMVQPDCQGNI